MESIGMMLYKNDKLFKLTDNGSTNASIIVITSQGEIRVGHNNYVGRAYRNNFSYEPPWEYIYFGTAPEKLLEDILIEKDAVKGLTKHYENVPSNLLKYLMNADLNEIRRALEYYKEITRPKKYILLHGSCNDNKDQIKITKISGNEEAQQIIEREFEDENYFGFFNVELNNSGYWFSLVVTDDEKLNSKYRDALNYEEFKKVCLEKFNEETLNYFTQVWCSEVTQAEKIWKKNKYEEDGQVYYSDSCSTWRTD